MHRTKHLINFAASAPISDDTKYKINSIDKTIKDVPPVHLQK